MTDQGVRRGQEGDPIAELRDQHLRSAHALEFGAEKLLTGEHRDRAVFEARVGQSVEFGGECAMQPGAGRVRLGKDNRMRRPKGYAADARRRRCGYCHRVKWCYCFNRVWCCGGCM